MSRRMLTLIAALIPVIVLAVVGSTVTVPFAALGPGPTVNTLGTVELEDGQVVDVVALSGPDSQVDPDPAGHLNMTTVSVRDGLSIFEALGIWASGRQGLVPRAEVFPPDQTKDEIEEHNQAEFAESENAAETAALHYLNFPFTLTVNDVVDDGPAIDVLRDDDQLLSINGVDLGSACQVRETVSAAEPNSDATIRVRRAGVEETVVVKLGKREGDEDKGFLGVDTAEKPDVPFTVGFNLEDVGGPSAGLMFSLALVDKLTPDDLSGGDFVAGTGTIDACGAVGPIGGIPYKMTAAREAGAVTFLVPADNCAEAVQRVPDGLRLVRVENLRDAVSSLESLRSGGDAPTC